MTPIMYAMLGGLAVIVVSFFAWCAWFLVTERIADRGARLRDEIKRLDRESLGWRDLYFAALARERDEPEKERENR